MNLFIKFILIIFFCSNSFFIYAQQRVSPIDMFRNSAMSVSISSGVPYQAASMVNIITYDSLREVTEVNAINEAEAFPWISADGLRLYYTNGAANNSLYFTSRADVNSYFSTPVQIPFSVPNQICYWLSKDELDLYCCSGLVVYYSHRNSLISAFSAPVSISFDIPLSVSRSFSLDSTQNNLFISHFGGPYQGINEYIRTSPTSFNWVRTMAMPAGVAGIAGTLSKDDLSYLFTNVSGPVSILCSMDRTSVNDTFDIATYSEIQNVNDQNYFIGQPSVSDNLDWIVFVRSLDNLWYNNDLYIACKAGALTTVFEPGSPEMIQIYPNPVINELNITGVAKGNFEILDLTGRRIMEGIIFDEVSKIELGIIPGGIYFVIINSGKYRTVKKIIVKKID